MSALKTLEEGYDLKQAWAALEAVEASEEKVYTLEEAAGILGVE